MPADTLEFEEPVAVLLKEVEALSMLPNTPQRQAEIDGLHKRIESIRPDNYTRLTAWERVLVARDANRPTVVD
jgi:acetyl-CoA carboxylase alpha subunit